jgi:hypothetical protein
MPPAIDLEPYKDEIINLTYTSMTIDAICIYLQQRYSINVARLYRPSDQQPPLRAEDEVEEMHVVDLTEEPRRNVRRIGWWEEV